MHQPLPPYIYPGPRTTTLPPTEWPEIRQYGPGTYNPEEEQARMSAYRQTFEAKKQAELDQRIQQIEAEKQRLAVAAEFVAKISASGGLVVRESQDGVKIAWRDEPTQAMDRRDLTSPTGIGEISSFGLRLNYLQEPRQAVLSSLVLGTGSLRAGTYRFVVTEEDIRDLIIPLLGKYRTGFQDEISFHSKIGIWRFTVNSVELEDKFRVEGPAVQLVIDWLEHFRVYA